MAMRGSDIDEIYCGIKDRLLVGAIGDRDMPFFGKGAGFIEGTGGYGIDTAILRCISKRKRHLFGNPAGAKNKKVHI